MADIRSKHIHERQIDVYLDRHELARVVWDYVAKQAGLDPEAKNLTRKVTFEDATEGSPSYRVGTKAKVAIVEALKGDAPDL